jgi:hypothetical protein
MSAQFDRLFGLTENPFRPVRRIGNAAPGAMNELDKRPLQVHRVPALKKLYVGTAGKFEEFVQSLEEEMETNGYSKQQPEEAQGSLTFVVRGPSGAGKTTLANYLTMTVSSYQLPAPKRWEIVDYLSVTEFAQLATQRERVVSILKAFTDKVTDNNYGCVIIDNLEAGDEDYIQAKLGELAQSRTVIAFLIARGNSDFGKKASFSAPTFGLDWLNQEEAVTFVETRLNAFRAQPPPAWVAQPQWTTFPFKNEDIRKAVILNFFKENPNDESAPSTTSIRNLNTVLARSLWLEGKRRANDGVDVRTLQPSGIGPYAMDLIGHISELWLRGINR